MIAKTSFNFLSQAAIVVALSLAISGCRPAERASDPSTQQAADKSKVAGKETSSTETDEFKQTRSNQPDTESPSDNRVPRKTGSEDQAAEVPAFSAEQIAAARQLAANLGVVIKEDNKGNVIGVDTAAKRSWVDDLQMERILVFPELRSLTVEGPSITHMLAPQIAKATKLTSLTMQTTMITNEGIAEFKKLKALKMIDLRLSPLVTDDAMASLAAMPELRAVRLSGMEITDEGLRTILQLPRLTELDLRNCRGVTHRGIEKLVAKKSLRTLKIGGATISDQVLDLVAQMKNLTGLSLDNCDISDTGISKLAGLPLVDFTIYQCANITDDGLDILGEFPHLKRLTLRDVAAKGTSLGKLPHPESLVSLNMAQSRITDAEVIHLENMSGLESQQGGARKVSNASASLEVH